MSETSVLKMLGANHVIGIQLLHLHFGRFNLREQANIAAPHISLWSPSKTPKWGPRAQKARSFAHLNKAVFKGGSPKLGESQGLGESLRLSPITGESLKLSPKLGESFGGESFNMTEL